MHAAVTEHDVFDRLTLEQGYHLEWFNYLSTTTLVLIPRLSVVDPPFPHCIYSVPVNCNENCGND